MELQLQVSEFVRNGKKHIVRSTKLELLHVEEHPVTCKNGLMPGQDPDGYGSKIVTNRVVKIKNRFHRIYATCFSNVASHWFIFQGNKIFVS